MTQSQSSQWKVPTMAFAVFAVIALGLFVLGSTGDDSIGSEHLAEAACEDFVKDKVATPSSAEFSGAKVTETGEGEWTVVGTVDADTRNRYTCDVWTIDGDTYEGRVTLTG
jgi:hypothetical protein